MHKTLGQADACIPTERRMSAPWPPVTVGISELYGHPAEMVLKEAAWAGTSISSMKLSRLLPIPVM